MKLLYFIIFTLYLCLPLARAENPEGNPSASVAKDTVEIKLSGSKKRYKCDLDPVSTYYLCQNDGRPMLVKNGVFGLSALTSNEDGPELKIVTSVVSKGKTVFQIPDFYPESKPTTAIDFSKEFEKKVTIVENFFKASPTSELSLPAGSKEFKKMAQKFLDDKEIIKQKSFGTFQEKEYAVELSSGHKLSCSRGGTRALTEEEQTLEKVYNTKFICGAFQCSPITIDGKSYKVTMLYDSNPGSLVSKTVHLIDEKGIGPKVQIKKISSDKSAVTLVDNSQQPQLMTSTDMYRGMISASIPEFIQDREKVIDYKSPEFTGTLQSYQNLCGKNNPALQELEEARTKLMLNLANADLTEFIKVLADGRLFGYYIDPNKAASMGCNYNGIYLDPTAASHLELLKKNIHPDKNVDQTITMDKARELFKSAQNMKDIAWKYKPDGCYARAHLMARRFEAQGVRVDKVWIKGDLYVPGTDIQWNFHVAPIVYVDNGKGQVQKMVIDPSLFDQPVTVEEWDKRMAKKTARGSTVTTFPFPENAALMERSVLAFSSSDPYLPGDSIHMSEQDKMNKANETMKRYKTKEPK